MNTPHIIIISTHDTGRHFGCYGVDTVYSPHIDTLATESLRFSRAFACAPVCGPSRSGMLTGRWPTSNGMYGQCHEGWYFHDDERHLAALLRERGYRTCVCGFQHETRKGGEAALGFDQALANQHEGSWFPPVPRAARVVDAGIDWFRTQSKRGPCYLQMGFWETHRPYTLPDIEPDTSRGVSIPSYLQPSERAQRDCAELQGSIRSVDAQIGRFLSAIDAMGVRGDCLLIFTTDHGLPLPRAKLTGYEPGSEISLLLRWPGRIEPGINDRLVSNVDLLPTLYGLLGWPPEARWQGVDAIDGTPRDAVYGACYLGDERWIRDDRYRLIRNLSKLMEYRCPVDLDDTGHYVVQETCGWKPVPPLEFFDLQTDPLEQHDRSADPACAELIAHYDARMRSWMQDCDDPALHGPMLQPRHRAFLERS